MNIDSSHIVLCYEQQRGVMKVHPVKIHNTAHHTSPLQNTPICTIDHLNRSLLDLPSDTNNYLCLDYCELTIFVLRLRASFHHYHLVI